jgi:hypothetical protein
VTVTDDDATATFYQGLQHRYGIVYPIDDADVRIILSLTPTKIILVEGGAIVGVVS